MASNLAAQKRFNDKMRRLHDDAWYATVGYEMVCRCPKCGTTGLAREMFYKHAASNSGYSSYCRICQLARNRDNKFLRRYGVSAKERDMIWEAAGRKCEICLIPVTPKQFHLDHCHTNGNIRGILCKSCNHGLGMFKDSIESLLNAISYLKARTKV
jgi:hypothetical protein